MFNSFVISISNKSIILVYLLSLQDCMFDNRDWRKCQEEMKSFKECMEKNAKRAVYGAK